MVRRVLVADDAPHIRRVFSRVLQKEGIEVTEVDNGDDVFEAALSSGAGLVLLDLDMPGRDPSGNLQLLRAHSQTASIPVVIITGNDDRGELEQVLNEGASDYIIKPPNLTQLRNRVNAYLDATTLARTRSSFEAERRSLCVALSRLADSKEPEQFNHGKRLLLYTERLCGRLRADGVEVPREHEICLASALHDLGKSRLPAGLLLAPRELEPAEREVMQTHCEMGVDSLSSLQIFDGASDFLEEVHDIILYHHESWDGSGYPRGLRGEEIPIGARLVAVGDSYDALTSRRAYREALTHLEAVEVISQGRGVRYDPRVVDAFLAEQDAFLEIRGEYPG